MLVENDSKHSAKMNNSEILNILKDKFLFINEEFNSVLEEKSEILVLEKSQKLIAFQSANRKIYFVAKGSFIRNIITSCGEEKTVMFHTESFCEFFKSYDTIYFHQKTNYEIVANEHSIVIAIDFDILMNCLKDNLEFLQFYIHETEKLFINIDLFRNLQLGLTSEEYLEWLYQNYAFLFQRFQAQNIASFMGITPVWLSKLKAKYIS